MEQQREVKLYSTVHGDIHGFATEPLTWEGTFLFWFTIICTCGFFVAIGFLAGRLTA